VRWSEEGVVGGVVLRVIAVVVDAVVGWVFFVAVKLDDVAALVKSDGLAALAATAETRAMHPLGHKRRAAGGRCGRRDRDA
jgi:hypothetical protein